jgi:hypothetical protein
MNTMNGEDGKPLEFLDSSRIRHILSYVGNSMLWLGFGDPWYIEPYGHLGFPKAIGVLEELDRVSDMGGRHWSSRNSCYLKEIQVLTKGAKPLDFKKSNHYAVHVYSQKVVWVGDAPMLHLTAQIKKESARTFRSLDRIGQRLLLVGYIRIASATKLAPRITAPA